MAQSYRNHARIVPVYHFGVLVAFLINIVWAFSRLSNELTVETALGVVMAVALMLFALSARGMALTVQDRVIRLEMQLRLRAVLPAAMHADIPRITTDQLIGLRFASDAELPDLVREVLAGSLTTRKSIKLKVRDWQADYLRA
jgi:hypothetical protein